MRRISSIALTLLLSALATMAVAVVVIPAVTGLRVITIDANSMQEVLPLGSIAYIKEQPEYGVGDIVTFRHSGQIITHQIVALVPNPSVLDPKTGIGAMDGLWLSTKGTSNTQDDPYPITRDQIIGRVLYSTPYMGVALKALGSLPVELFLGLTAIGLYYLSTASGSDRRKAQPA